MRGKTRILCCYDYHVCKLLLASGRSLVESSWQAVDKVTMNTLQLCPCVHSLCHAFFYPDSSPIPDNFLFFKYKNHFGFVDCNFPSFPVCTD